jgi:putative membrane protein
MVIHVIEMFFLPPLLILGNPSGPISFALPVDRRRRLLRALYLSRGARPVRALRSVIVNPLVAIVVFNATMVLWHVPVIFDWASWHNWVMNWLMAPSFVLSGLLFWRVVLPSGPRLARGGTQVQLAGIAVTAFEMLVLAMSMSIFTSTPWYSMNIAMSGRAAALSDQRLAAGILWICGDFWAIPALIVVLRRAVVSQGGVSATIERALGRV